MAGIDFRLLNHMRDLQKCNLFEKPTYDRYKVLAAGLRARRKHLLAARAGTAAAKLSLKHNDI